ncbi:hypothetical protein [Nocardia sp. NPDC050718]|uniref:hypothetical protein n=1 Tax=Nocardia sp. NPDC050718 TaxID=3155788 RepID=UPI0033C3F70C
MVGLDPALRRLTRDVGKLLQPYGFRGSEARWTQVAAGGVASVGRGRVQRSWTDGQQEVRFGLEVNATPTAWWEFGDWCRQRLGGPPTTLADATGPGLVELRGIPAECTEPWSLRVDPTVDGQQVRQSDIEALRAELPRRVHVYARRALRLLEPDRYLDELLADPDPGLRTWEAVVVLLAERGPGDRLDEALARYETCLRAEDAQLAPVNALAYVRDRVATA